MILCVHQDNRTHLCKSVLHVQALRYSLIILTSYSQFKIHCFIQCKGRSKFCAWTSVDVESFSHSCFVKLSLQGPDNLHSYSLDIVKFLCWFLLCNQKYIMANSLLQYSPFSTELYSQENYSDYHFSCWCHWHSILHGNNDMNQHLIPKDSENRKI